MSDIDISSSDRLNRELVACPSCDALLARPALAVGERARCPRCYSVVLTNKTESAERTVALMVASVALFILVTFYPFLKMQSSGLSNQISVADAINILWKTGFPFLAAGCVLLILGIPLLRILLTLAVALALLAGRPITYNVRRTYGWALRLAPWSMADIFMLGVVVSLVKVGQLADIQLGIAFWALAGHECRHQPWIHHHVRRHTLATREAAAMRTAKSEGLSVCRTCQSLSVGDDVTCSMCGARVHMRIAGSIHRTWAFLIAGIAAYVPGNLLPIMITNTPTGSQSSTILGGVVTLMHHGSYDIAMVILVASIGVPLGKFAVVIWLALSIQNQWVSDEHTRHRAHEVVEILGAWSMVDVFVVAALAALIQLGGLMSITPGPGAGYFALSVGLTMLAARSLDPRLIWDTSNDAS